MLVQFGFFENIDDINQDILDQVLDPNMDGEFDMLDFKRFIQSNKAEDYDENKHIRLK